MRRTGWITFALLFGSALSASAADTRPVPNRWAILVRVDDYVWAQKLVYAGADMKALGEQLVASGFPADHVYLLHDKAIESKYRPIKVNIETHLKVVLGLVGRDDMVVIGFAGHGVHLDGKSYLCPEEAKLDDASTLISLDSVYESLNSSGAALKLMLVDACRNDPSVGGTRSLGGRGTGQFAQSLEKPPQGILLMTSCAPGEVAREEQEFGHGIFMHFMLEGIKGQADANRNGRVSLMELYLFANEKTKTYVAKKFVDSQRPSLKGDIQDDFDIAEVPRDSDPLIINSIGMKLVRIPDGEFLMGSPNGEGYRDDDEYQHRVRITKPFHLGVYEVTQDEYQRVMGDNPSHFAPTGYGKNNVRGQDTSRFPVEQVSLDHALAFCLKLTAMPEEQRAGRVYRLPTEAEWEYACRAGTSTPFHFGSQLNGSEANCDGTSPYGTTTEGAYLERTKTVGSYPPNAFGLYDMHGNVCEWCQDWYDKDYYRGSPMDDPHGPTHASDRVYRGGSWFQSTWNCRAANRAKCPASVWSTDLGFRVALFPRGG